VNVLPWVFSSGWASGINGYAVVLLLGLGGRYFGVQGVPPAIERTDVLLAAAVLVLIDAVADKIPYLDTIWDTVHTAIRPTIGAVLGVLLAGHAGSLTQIVGRGHGRHHRARQPPGQVRPSSCGQRLPRTGEQRPDQYRGGRCRGGRGQLVDAAPLAGRRDRRAAAVCGTVAGRRALAADSSLP
jgi:hypothetical protein